jgi:hypothetical protein
MDRLKDGLLGRCLLYPGRWAFGLVGSKRQTNVYNHIAQVSTLGHTFPGARLLTIGNMIKVCIQW